MRFLRIFLVFMQTGLLVLGLIFTFFSRNLPDIEIITEIKLTNPMRVYTKDEKLIGQFGTEKRERDYKTPNPGPGSYNIPCKFNDVPKYLMNG